MKEFSYFYSAEKLDLNGTVKSWSSGIVSFSGKRPHPNEVQKTVIEHVKVNGKDGRDVRIIALNRI